MNRPLMNRPVTRWLKQAILSRRPLMALRWLLLLSWMGLIFWFSADADSGATSGGVLEVLARLFSGILGPLSPEARDGLHMLLRKAAHFTEFAVLALLWLGVLPNHPRRLLWAFLLTTGYAVTDEVHQAFVPNRVSSPVDVLIDSCGALTALLAYRLRSHYPLDRLTKIH